AEFIDLLVSPLPSSWVLGNIGTNSAEQLYVALSDGINTAVVEHNDVNAATLTSWQEWNIDLAAFSGVNLNNVQKVYIGLGDRGTPVQGGSGALYIDDLRSCPPRCVAAFGKPQADIAQPYDCLVNEADIMVLSNDYLLRDRLITTSAPSDTNLAAHYQFENNLLDSSVHGNNGDPCNTIGYEVDPARGNVLSLPGGSNNFADMHGVGIDGNVPRTIACWAKADHMNIPDWTLIFGFTGNADESGGNGSHFNIGSLGGPGGIGAHTWGWEETIFPDEDTLDWRHYTMTYDGSTILYYGDGVLMDTDPAKSNVQNLVHADRVHVGSRITQASSFPGKVDEARIYSVVLTEPEVAYLATDGAATLHVPIVSDADLYQGEAQGSQWINLRDYSVISDQYLDELLWP
ncbi:MAG: LamG domain-containing protein, partial [Planctomycetes bacterium]|nr:LamG domain-containing protein [Planctomycetota bacterium]